MDSGTSQYMALNMLYCTPKYCTHVTSSPIALNRGGQHHMFHVTVVLDAHECSLEKRRSTIQSNRLQYHSHKTFMNFIFFFFFFFFFF